MQYVLTSMLVYILMALELPPCALKAIDKIRKGFLWKDRKDARGGHCLLAWPKVTRPIYLGGLGISDLQNMGYALQLRWLWLQKTDPEKAWAIIPIKASSKVQSFFEVAVETVVGNGKNTRFWTDCWLLGQSLKQALPHLFSAIAVRARKRTVYDALNDGKWISDIKGALSVPVLVEYLHLWDILSNVVLQPEVEDAHIWKFTTSGKYSSKSAYEALFIGATQFSPWEIIWKSWAPGNANFSCGQWPTKGAGLLIGLHGMVLITHQNVLYVTRRVKQLTTYWFLVCSPGNFGSSFYRVLVYRLLLHR